MKPNSYESSHRTSISGISFFVKLRLNYLVDYTINWISFGYFAASFLSYFRSDELSQTVKDELLTIVTLKPSYPDQFPDYANIPPVCQPVGVLVQLAL